MQLWNKDFIMSARSHGPIGCVGGYPFPSLEILLGITEKNDANPHTRVFKKKHPSPVKKECRNLPQTR